MTQPKAGPWILGAAFLALGCLAIAWFFAIAPQLDEASAAREQAQSERDRNDLLEVQIAKLAADFERIDEFKAERAQLSVGIPATLDQAAFNRELDALSVGTGAFVVEVTSGTSTPVTSTFAVPAAGELAGVGAAPAGLYAIPMTVTILGTPEATLTYINSLQQNTSRLFLVSGVALAGQDEAGAAGGKPAIAAGDAEIVISGFTYVLTDDAPGAVQPAAPVPVPDEAPTTS